MDYNNRYTDRYKKFITQGWYDNSFSSENLDVWNNNFTVRLTSIPNFDPKICAHFLLDSLVFYQERQLEALIYSITNKIKTMINQEEQRKIGKRLSDQELNACWNEYKSKMCIIPAAESYDVSSSAYQMCRIWRNEVGIDTLSIEKLPSVIGEKSHVFFADDFIGTGKKINKFFESQLLQTLDGDILLKDFMNKEKNKVDFNVSVFAIYYEGYELVNTNYPYISCYYGDFYNSQYNMASNECVFYDEFEENKSQIIKYIEAKNKELNYNKDYVRNLPIAFHHGCPNNSSPLYYASNDNWRNLLKESHPNIQTK